MKSLFTIFAAFALSLNVLAAEVKVCTITSDVDKEAGELRVEVVDGRVDSMRIITLVEQRVLADDSYPVERLMDDGLVATEKDGYEVVVLRLENFNASRGGTVVIDYLVNGVTGNRKKFRVNFIKEGNEFVLKTVQGQRINRLHFRANRIFGKLVGLKNVETSLR